MKHAIAQEITVSHHEEGDSWVAIFTRAYCTYFYNTTNRLFSFEVVEPAKNPSTSEDTCSHHEEGDTWVAIFTLAHIFR